MKIIYKTALSVFAICILLNCNDIQKRSPSVPRFELSQDWLKLPDDIILDQTTGVAVDSGDNVYVFHRGTPPVLCFRRDGTFIRGFGEGYINWAHGLEIAPDNTLWVTDNRDHIVLHFSPDGVLLHTLGIRGTAGESDTAFNRPTDVAISSSGDLFITDGYGNSRVAVFSENLEFQHAWGDSGTAPGQFNLPHANAFDSQERLFVCDRENSRIQIFNTDGQFLSQWTHLGQPWGIFITKDDMVCVVDGKNEKVLILNISGDILASWGSHGSEPGQFDVIHDIAVDSHGDIYIAEILGKRVQKYIRQS